MISAVLSVVLVLFATGAVGAVAAGRAFGRQLVYGLSLAASLALVGLGLAGWFGAGGSLVLPLGLPWLGAHVAVDALTGFFLVVVNIGGAAAGLYGLGHGRHEPSPGRILPFFPVFLGAMNLVLVADDAFVFLLGWETMSLASWALVMAHHRVPGNAHAGYVYIVMAAFGTLALLLAFGLLAGAAGAYAFDSLRAAELGSLPTILVLGLVLIGAGSKAGLVPLHVWLPLAHPAAPSHVSALMSGVMTKVALYGLIRILFDLLGDPEWWWGVPLLVLGAASAVLGVLHAVFEEDLKRLLAYSTVENVGLIAIALGLALAFQANGLAVGAAVAMAAALLHAFNHGLFKTLLFLGAGAVLGATGQRHLGRHGGLIRLMPATALLFLVGSLAIAALPPLNGFASEWLLFQAILLSPELPQWVMKFLVPGVGALVALSAVLAAACYVKAFGIVFLGRPRAAEASAAHETDPLSLAAMAVLALLCVLAGLMPGLIAGGLEPALAIAVGTGWPEMASNGPLLLIPAAPGRSAYSGLLLGLLVALFGFATAHLIHRFASGAVRRAPAWDCGFPEAQPAAQYGGSSLAQPLRRVFGPMLFRATEAVDMPDPGDARPARLELRQRDLVWDALYRPIAGLIHAVAGRLNRMQFLTIRRYLSMMFAALLLLLVVVAVWS